MGVLFTPLKGGSETPTEGLDCNSTYNTLRGVHGRTHFNSEVMDGVWKLIIYPNVWMVGSD